MLIKPLNEEVYDYIFRHGTQNTEGVAVANIKSDFKRDYGTSASSISGIIHGMLSEGRIIKPARGKYLPNINAKFAKRSDIIKMLASDIAVLENKYKNLSFENYQSLNPEDKVAYQTIMEQLHKILN